MLLLKIIKFSGYEVWSVVSIKNVLEKTLMMKPTRKTINTPMLGKSSPAQYIGVKLSDFSIYHNEFIDTDGGDNINLATETANILIEARKKNYYDIVENLKNLTSLNDSKEGVKTKYYFEEYRDFSLDANSTPDRERWIIRIVRITPRQTIISSLCRFYTNGVNLYVGIDSYFLGRISRVSLVTHTLLLLIFGFMFLVGFLQTLLALVSIITNQLSIFSLFVNVLPVIGSGLYLYFSWFPVVKALLDGENYITALKSRFHDRKFRNLFDRDDVLTYLKSVLPFILQRVKIVLANQGIKDPNIYEQLDQIIDKIEGQQITVNNSGYMFGIQFGNNNVQQND